MVKKQDENYDVWPGKEMQKKNTEQKNERNDVTGKNNRINLQMKTKKIPNESI